jgi:hypothetical protein
VKKLTLFVVAAAAAFSFTSCKKCSTCSVKYNTPMAGQQEYTAPEACGKKKDVEAYESAFKSAYSSYGTVTCK